MTLKISRFACSCLLGVTWKRFAIRRSSRVTRGLKSTLDAESGVVALGVHGVRVPQAARLRPSSGATTEFGAAQLAVMVEPGRFWMRPLRRRSPGNQTFPLNFT